MGKILALLGRAGNRWALAHALREHELVFRDKDEAEPLNGDVDLIITDRQEFVRWRAELAVVRAAEAPALLPVLLTLPENQLRVATPLLGHEVDDVVTTPVQGEQLRARVQNLVRLRQISVQQRDRIKQTTLSLRGIDRAYSILATCNEHVIRATTEADLYERALEDLAGNEGYLAAWIGRARQDDQRSIEILAHSEVSRTYLYSKPIRWGDDELGQGPAGTAIRERRPVACQNTATDPRFAPWRDAALARGIASTLALPLTIGAEEIGLLCLYSDTVAAFTTAEIDLLRRMADNISHGIQALRAQVALKAQKEMAQYRAYRDSLTSLPNRQWVLEELEKLDAVAARHARAAAVLFLDLDGFKRINDGLGHDVGDRLLCLVAERLQELARDEDFVARLGGDEFLILMTLDLQSHPVDAHLEQRQELARAADRLAQRVVEGMQIAFRDGSHEHYLGVSVGIGLFPGDTDRAAELVNCADVAMYQAKTLGGRGYRFYSNDLIPNQRCQLQLETRLHGAVDRNEFEVYYQPILSLETSRIVTVEALMRWRQSDGSVKSPDEFIHILEETGLISRAGQWVIRQACRDVRRCREEAPGLQLALNLSINQLWQPRLAAQIEEIARAEDLPPQAIILELTETTMMSNIRRIESLIQDFHSAGFKIAIDDFGIGYSSLGRLKTLPVSTLKLDKSFLVGMPHEPDAVSMVTTIVQMAQNLKIQLVAEGIETQAQYQFLRQLGCPLGQGFLFAAPMPFEAFVHFLRSERLALME